MKNCKRKFHLILGYINNLKMFKNTTIILNQSNFLYMTTHVYPDDEFKRLFIYHFSDYVTAVAFEIKPSFFKTSLDNQSFSSVSSTEGYAYREFSSGKSCT